jgi:hypothetical protein
LQAQFLIPIAASLAFRVRFATLITLYLVPTAYMIREDAGSALRPSANVRRRDAASPD